jgi:hypothetical protein
VNAGDTFKFSFSMHLWIVVSDPQIDADEVLLVSFTSNKSWQDQACVLRPGDHRFLVKETVLYYAKAKVLSNSELDALLAAGDLVLDDPVTSEVLARIREGARMSNRIAFRHRQLLIDQGLVAP